MSDDLVKRLRDPSLGSPRWMDTMAEAADRISELEAALRLYADDNYNGYNGNGAHARAVLEGGGSHE